MVMSKSQLDSRIQIDRGRPILPISRLRQKKANRASQSPGRSAFPTQQTWAREYQRKPFSARYSPFFQVFAQSQNLHAPAAAQIPALSNAYCKSAALRERLLSWMQLLAGFAP